MFIEIIVLTLFNTKSTGQIQVGIWRWKTVSFSKEAVKLAFLRSLCSSADMKEQPLWFCWRQHLHIVWPC